MVISLKKEELTYTSCYCEENVWLICDRIRNGDPDSLGDFHVVFISNEDRMIPLWRQSAGKPEFDDERVVWDYHVIQVDAARRLVLDLDTTLDFPCDFNVYLASAIKNERLFIPRFRRRFRRRGRRTKLSLFL